MKKLLLSIFCVMSFFAYSQDDEYQKYLERKIFSDKDLAADYAWKLFGGDEEFKKVLDKNK